MSRCSGFILAVMLVSICLWINICRYPSVWIMLKGEYTPQTASGSDSVRATSPQDDKSDKSDKDKASTKDKQRAKDKSDRPNGLVAADDDNPNAFHTVSYDSTPNAAGQSRGPVPVVPKARPGKKKAKTGKEEPKSRPAPSGSKDEDNTLRDSVFRDATITKPVDSSDSGTEPPTGDQRDAKPKSPAEGDDTSTDSSEENAENDASDGYVSVLVPAEKDQKTTQLSGIHLTSGSSYSPYHAVGTPGTRPMSFDQPAY